MATRFKAKAERVRKNERRRVLLLQKGLGRCRKQRYGLILEINIFYQQ